MCHNQALMLKTISFTTIAFLLCAGLAHAQEQTVIKGTNGEPMMWEVELAKPKETKEQKLDLQNKIEQAKQNEAEYLQQQKMQNVLPAQVGTPGFIPYSTVGPAYEISGTEWTPFRIRDYSYGGSSQSFGAPMFYGYEIPSPVFNYPTMFPLGGEITIPEQRTDSK